MVFDNEPVDFRKVRAKSARLMGRKLAPVPQAMDDDWLDVNCGRCGRALVMRIDDLRDRPTVECAECAASAKRDESGAPSPTVESSLSLPQRPDPHRRDPC